MPTLARLLLPLALFHVAYGLLTDNDALNVVATDAINDAIRYYNHINKKSPPPALADVVGVTLISGTPGVDMYTYNVTASEGYILSKGIKLAAKSANVTLEQKNDSSLVIHNLTASFPVTIKDLKLQYDHLHVRYTEDSRPIKPSQRAAPVPTGAIKICIGENKIAVQARTIHFYNKKNVFLGCVATITKAVPEQFEVKNITISGMVDTFIQKDLTKIANEFKERLTKLTQATVITERLLKEKAHNLFRYCDFVPHQVYGASTLAAYHKYSSLRS